MKRPFTSLHLPRLLPLTASTGGPCASPLVRLTHQSGETLERPRYPHTGVDLDKNALGGVNVDLQETGLVEGRVKQRKETLVGDIGASVGNVTARLCQDTLVVVAVEQRVLGLLARRVLAT